MPEVLTYEALKAERDALADRVDRLGGMLTESRAATKSAEERADALAVESIGLRHIAERIVNALYAAGYEPEENSLHPWKSLIFDAEKALNTPATDAALAAIQAQGVERAAVTLYGSGYVFEVLMRHAAELREAK
ncbi:hypothetical protein [Serratia ureilytica]|uniref:hypothetical protein n=1 Tax=Serratia ureilytica TaxID=300181 RepID=UPI001866F0A4|nr:hypothetical protein [Serratia ureilytica]